MPDPNNADDDANELEGVNMDDSTTDDTGARNDKLKKPPFTEEGNNVSQAD